MSKPSQRKRAKQRKREAKRKQRQSEPVSLAYTGKKYRTDALIPFHFATETAIYDCFVMTRRQLTDHHARAALEELIVELRRGPLPEWSVEDPLVLAAGDEVDFLIVNIRHHWHDYLECHSHPGRDNVIGVLRSILASIDCWGSISPQSRGYLEYIEEFCKKMGYMTAPMEIPPDIEEDPEPRPSRFSSFFP